MYAHPQEHTHENMHKQTKLACAENIYIIFQAQLQPDGNGIIMERNYQMITQEHEGACYWRNFEPGDEPEMPVSDQRDRL